MFQRPVKGIPYINLFVAKTPSGQLGLMSFNAL